MGQRTYRWTKGHSRMPSPIKPFDKSKSHVDLWMHQNTLSWSRYTLLTQFQIAIFALLYALSSKAWPISVIAGMLGAAITFFLWQCLAADLNLREAHANILAQDEEMNPGRPLNPLRQDGEAFRQEMFKHKCIFGALIILDTGLGCTLRWLI